MTRLSWSRRARDDLRAIAAHYDTIDQLLARVRAGLVPFFDHPHLGPPAGPHGVRKWIVRATPFVLLYRPRRDGLDILAVRHTRQDWRTP